MLKSEMTHLLPMYNNIGIKDEGSLCTEPVLQICENSWHCLSSPSNATQILAVDSDWSQSNLVDSDWLLSKRSAKNQP